MMKQGKSKFTPDKRGSGEGTTCWKSLGWLKQCIQETSEVKKSHCQVQFRNRHHNRLLQDQSRCQALQPGWATAAGLAIHGAGGCTHTLEITNCWKQEGRHMWLVWQKLYFITRRVITQGLHSNFLIVDLRRSPQGCPPIKYILA